LPLLELIDAQRTLSRIQLRVLELRKELVVAEAKLMGLGGIGPYGAEGDME
jgi:outer membrane protein TolC